MEYNILTQNTKGDANMMRALYYQNAQIVLHKSFKNIKNILDNKDGMLWIDFENPTDEEYNFLHKELGFHYLAVEDCRDQGVKPKIEDYGEFLFFVFRGINYSSGIHALDTLGIKIFLSRRMLVSVHHKTSKTIEEVIKRIEENIQLMECVEILLFTILDTLTDNITPIITHVEKRLELFQHHIFKHFSPTILEELFEMKKWVLRLRHYLVPQKVIIERLMKIEHPLFRRDLSYYLRDVHDHTQQVLEHLEIYEQLLPDAMNSYLAQITNRMNEVMKTMSIIATLMLPLSFITGIFGMNFYQMPLVEKGLSGFWTLVGTMVLIFVGMIFYFRKKDWF